MTLGKFASWEGRYLAKVLDLEGYYRGLHRRTLVWLLASALGVLGTADVSASSGPSHKLASPHRKKAIEVKHHEHMIEQPAIGDQRRHRCCRILPPRSTQ